MAFVATPDAAKVYLKCHNTAQTWGATLWFTKPGFVLADLQTLVDLVQTRWKANVATHLHNSTVIGDFVAYDMRVAGGMVATASVGTANGVMVGDRMSLSDACVLTLYTALRGRAHRGRIFQSGYAEDAYSSGAFIAAAMNGLTLAYTGVFSDAGVAGWTPGVRSGQLNGVPRVPPVVTPITTWAVRTGVEGSQRRRTHRS